MPLAADHQPCVPPPSPPLPLRQAEFDCLGRFVACAPAGHALVALQIALDMTAVTILRHEPKLEGIAEIGHLIWCASARAA